MPDPLVPWLLFGLLIAFEWLVFLSIWMLLHTGNQWRGHGSARAAEPPWLPNEVIGGPGQDIGPSLMWDRRKRSNDVNSSPSGAEPTAKVRAG